jgi:hypothetical protein
MAHAEKLTSWGSLGQWARHENAIGDGPSAPHSLPEEEQSAPIPKEALILRATALSLW